MQILIAKYIATLILKYLVQKIVKIIYSDYTFYLGNFWMDIIKQKLEW